ncbi:hypothetical protein [Candidatus Poriferisodalis sp.]|uniref:hypothetical protein n=1 Tax=Candidatus Poriferisodalis sp. TaxID=3101277 RepID=UPI003B01E138
MSTSDVTAHMRGGRPVRGHTRTGVRRPSSAPADSSQAAQAAQAAADAAGSDQPAGDDRPVLCELGQLRAGDIVRVPGITDNQRVLYAPRLFPERFDLYTESVRTGDSTNIGTTRGPRTTVERLTSPDSVGLSGWPTKLESGEWGVAIHDPDGMLEAGDTMPCHVLPRSKHTRPWVQMTEVVAVTRDENGGRIVHGRKAAADSG